MKKTFYIEIKDYELEYECIGINSYSHTCKINGYRRIYFHDTSKHVLYKKLCKINFSIFDPIPEIHEIEGI